MTTCANPRCAEQFSDRRNRNGTTQKYCNIKCRISQSNARHRSTDKAKATAKTYYAKYATTNKCKTLKKQRAIKYQASEKGKATNKRGRAKYSATDKGKATIRQCSQRRRALKKKAFVEDVNVMFLADWQEWKCYLCNKSIPKHVKHSNPLSISLDHLVPLSKGGQHSYANCAAVHLVCNKSKQAKAIGEQLKLC